MRSISRFFVVMILATGLLTVISCNGDDGGDDCTSCSDDAPYGTLGGSACYATRSECEAAESGNCVICQ